MNRCETVREWIQERLDGPGPYERTEELDGHLRACAECREVEDGLRRVQEALRALPEIPLPDSVLKTVWARTTGTQPISRPQSAGRPPHRAAGRSTSAWWLAAAAAVMTTALLLWLGRSNPSPPSAADFAQAESDARLALVVAARALHSSERTAVERVLATEVAPVLRRIPVHWPRPLESDPRRSRS